MIKLTFAVRRRTDIDQAEFHSYWCDQHGPLVRSLEPVLGIRRYVQTHRLETPLNDVLRASRSALEPFDGV
ncbi:MAG TPA: EthD domain-containing protein, partial [Acidimicrobiales bacterium]|nr:EthD domain-containing protein [Acidimicrobiales bacterium]